MPVESCHLQHQKACGRWRRCRDASAGQDAVHAGRTLYLPQLTDQTPGEYRAYVDRALYYNATGRTVDGLTGMVFRKPPAFDLPEAVAGLVNDSDASGKPLMTLCDQSMSELLKMGRFGLFVDFTSTENARTMAEFRASGARPLIQLYTAESIINWRVEKIDKRWELTLVVLEEVVEKAQDEYTADCVKQWRVLKLVDGIYQLEVHRELEGGRTELVAEETTIPQMNGQPMKFIPFLICGPEGISPEVAKPPLLDLVDVNLSHYRSTADYEHGLHFTGLPTPIVTGHEFETGQSLKLGSSSAQAFANENAKAFFLEFEGVGLEQLSKRLQEKEQMMVALGARMLASERRAVEAAETAAIHRSGEQSTLASLANAVSMAVTKALNWCCQWVGAQQTAKATLNTDYLPSGLTSQELAALVKAWQDGAISYPTLYDNLLRGEIARTGVTVEEEQLEIGNTAGTFNEDESAV